MELEHSFTVPVPVDQAWDVLLDVEKVAPCMPGATIESVDDDQIRGSIKVKVGPINMTYAGTARFVEKDRAAGVVRLEATGKETRGAGTASASVRSVLEEAGAETKVVVLTTLNVTGKPAQFGRGVMNEVGGRLLTIFAENLAATLAESHAGGAPGPPAAAEPAVAESEAAASAADLSAPVDELALYPRAVASLHRSGIMTISELAAKTADELIAIDGIGQATVDDITAKLAERGLSLGQPVVVATPVTAIAADTEADIPSGVARAPQLPVAHETTPKHARHHHDDDAINLLRVAGLPVLKRALPVIAGLTAAALLGMARLRRRRRARS
jgi:carbon monoxide dehydrogenase subunit G